MPRAKPKPEPKSKAKPAAKPKVKNVKVHIGKDMRDSNLIVGDYNTVTVVYHGEKVAIPAAEAVARHRAELGKKLAEDAKARWGAYYIQEEAAKLPIEASPYNTGQLGARTNLLAALKSSKRMLVLGDPGSGKTVALEQLAKELCAGAEPVIPVIIKLFKYDGKPLADWTWARLQERGELHFKDVTALNAFLQEGAARCVFLFDGLNEVAPEFRNTLAGELDRWMSAYPRHAVIISSRVQDELWRRLREEIPAVVVQTIQREQAREYLVQYLGTEKGNELYLRLGVRLKALSLTPLILWLVKEAGAADEDLPGNRGELYARFVTKMLKRDVERRMGIKFTEGAKRRALAALALHLGQAQRLNCTREEAREVMTGALEKDASEERAEALLEVCKEHGLLAGEDDKLWFAPHQTVQEYFAAVALQDIVRKEQEMNGVVKIWSNALQTLMGKKESLHALAMEDWWMETMVQLAGLVDDPAWLARALAETNPWLAWWCVQEGKGVDDKTRALIEDRSSKLLGSSKVEDRRRAVQTLTQSRNERVMRPLLQAAGDKDAEISRLAVHGLIDLGEAARMHIEDVLHGKDEHLWKCTLPYLRALPKDYLWLEIPEKMKDELTKLDLRKLIKARSRKENQTTFWKLPYGEPEWVTIPAGKFWMGSKKGKDNEKPLHKLYLPEYQIARTPITNAQYALYIQDTGVHAPQYWKNGKIPTGLENHPVTRVTYRDVIAYCRWLSEKIKKKVTLPSEAEWEKAARGVEDQREYPWGDDWCGLNCNSQELGLKNTTSVGSYPNGASPYGLLDMSGNVWEWTRSRMGKYPYRASSRRESLNYHIGGDGGFGHILRGGSFLNEYQDVRCVRRVSGHSNLTYLGHPGFRSYIRGFRIVVSPPSL